MRIALDVVATVAGVVLLVWGLVVMANPTITCRGVVMHPGDTCFKATYTSTRSDIVQSYEQRRRAVAQSRPTVIGLGAALTLFGVGMSWATVRSFRREEDEDRPSGRHSSDNPIGP